VGGWHLKQRKTPSGEEGERQSREGQVRKGKEIPFGKKVKGRNVTTKGRRIVNKGANKSCWKGGMPLGENAVNWRTWTTKRTVTVYGGKWRRESENQKLK